MFRFLKWVLILAALLGAVAAAIVYTGATVRIAYWLYAPSHGWDLSKKAPDPDYSDAKNWAALPGQDGLANRAPPGEPVADTGVDVFFVHPTGYLHGAEWNSPMDPKSRTEENTKWMMANQASAFSSCCRVFAPRYREATIWRYLGAPEDIAAKTMDFAYADVVRAFENFIATRNENRPFILAGHSQGTTHGFRLLADKIDGTPLQARMVAAYLIGSRVTNAEAARLKSVQVCDAPDQTGCLVHYATFGPDAGPGADYRDLVCVNPLNWRRDGARVEKDAHTGGVPSSGRFQMAWGDDTATGVEFKPLGAPVGKLTGAACEKGLLIADDLRESPFKSLILQRWNYHGLDYPLFHMDLRRNIDVRIKAFQGRPPG
jgi:Protein of unknown function (DUF3089)